LIVEVEAGGLISGKSGMEKDAGKALGAERYPLVRFEQTGSLELPMGPNPQPSMLIINGILQIRDQSMAVQIEAQISISEHTIRIEGSHTVDMTDYGVEPPRALLGLIKTGEEVTIDFETLWKPS
jgi:polyisoprenoid-binding protein YceI